MFRFNRRQIGFVLVVALLLIPAAAVAGHRFADVPNSNIFHNDISWLADKGITKGCNPPANTLFCPKGGVTREQMAAFMHRAEKQLGTRYASVFREDIPLRDNTPTRLVTATMTAPSDGGAITIKGIASIEEGTSDQSGFTWTEVDNGGKCNLSSPVGGTIGSTWDTWGVGFASGTTTGGVPVDSGRYRVDLCTWGFGPTSTVMAELEVIWIATGATGGDVTFQRTATFGVGDSKAHIDELRSRRDARPSD
jgi:hypothetical protein